MMLAESVPTEDLSLDMIFDSIGSEVAGAGAIEIYRKVFYCNFVLDIQHPKPYK